MTNGGRQSTAAAIAGGWATACVVVAYAVVAAGRQRRRRDELEKEVNRQVALRNGEHAGRVKAEKVCDKLLFLQTDHVHRTEQRRHASHGVSHSTPQGLIRGSKVLH